MIRYLLFVILFVSSLSANIPTPFNKQANILGAFSFTLTDFNLQVGDLPLQLNRTYSTLQRSKNGAITYGWMVIRKERKLYKNMAKTIDKPHRDRIELEDKLLDKIKELFGE